MTYSQSIKQELLTLKLDDMHCAKSFLYGFLLTSNRFESQKIRFLCENADVMGAIAELIRHVAGIDPDAYIEEIISMKEDSNYRFLCTDQETCAAILQAFGYTDLSHTYTLLKTVFVCENCPRAFFRGVYLAVGNMSDPQKGYHCELSSPKFNLSRDLLHLLEKSGLPFKYTKRAPYYVLYTKESEVIADFLTYIGATGSTLDLLNTKIEKEMRNSVNRLINCETANLQKTIGSSAVSRDAIELLDKSGKLDTLSEGLIETARLRVAHPEATIAALAALHDPPVTKSCVDHRLQKLIKLSKED